jgi:predicted  nucleic acid-binding Zn-ribbon protein
MAEKMINAVQRVLLPELQEIKGELKAINARISASDAKLDAMDSKISATNSKIEAFRNEFRSETKRLDEKIDGLSSQFETQRKLSVLEAKVAELEKRS